MKKPHAAMMPDPAVVTANFPRAHEPMMRGTLVREAHRLGFRDGLAKRVASFIKSPLEQMTVRAAILSAPTEAEALRIAHEALSEHRDALLAEDRKLQAQEHHVQRLVGVYRDIADWLEGDMSLSAPRESLLHAICAQNVIMSTREPHPEPPEIEQAQRDGSGIFLVQHDWAKAFAKADADIGEWRLPYDRCCFEFEIGGRHVCAIVACSDGLPYRLLPFIRAKGGWYIECSWSISGDDLSAERFEGREDDFYLRPIAQSLFEHIRAIAIMLDAEVIRSDVVRQPHDGHQPRRGNAPKREHHVLSLVRRASAVIRSEGDATGSKKRLHFRRGHWRHYATFKTWIRWTMVGDPSLGFADKDYRL